MSWRPSGGSSPQASRPTPPDPSDKGGPKLIDPTLQVIIIASLVIGLVGLGLMAAFGGALGSGQVAGQPAPAQPAARPTAPPVATTAPAAAAQPTAAPAAGGAAGIPTEPLGPALASGSGEALAVASQGDQPLFDIEALEASSGAIYTLTFQNTGAAVPHNFVIVEEDAVEAVNTAAQEGLRATRDVNAAVPPADTPGLIVSTQMLAPGEEVTFSFTAPDPGTYLFICTYPGHYLTMRGELTVN